MRSPPGHDRLSQFPGWPARAGYRPPKPRQIIDP